MYELDISNHNKQTIVFNKCIKLILILFFFLEIIKVDVFIHSSRISNIWSKILIWIHIGIVEKKEKGNLRIYLIYT